MQKHLWEQHPDQIKIISPSGKKRPGLIQFPKAGLLIFCYLFMLEIDPNQAISSTNFENSRIENIVWSFNEGYFLACREKLTFISNSLSTLLISQDRTSPDYFPEDGGFLSKIWSVIWRIPWNSKFGILLEWLPLIISLVWLLIWYLIMVVIVRRAIAMGDDDPDTFFIQFTRFAQVFYLFCSIQAVF